MMLSSLRRFTVIAGMTGAVAGAGPVALSSAATTPAIPTIPSIPTIPIPTLPTLPNLLFPGQSTAPGQSCTGDQGQLPGGLTNLGPTGPLGPLGPSGPLGNGKSLPCGVNALNLGPSGPLGPHGPLGGPAGTG